MQRSRLIHFHFPLVDSSSFREAWRKLKRLTWRVPHVAVPVCVTSPEVTAATTAVTSPSSTTGLQVQGVITNGFRFCFACDAPFLSAPCCDTAGTGTARKPPQGSFGPQGKAHASVKTLFQNLLFNCYSAIYNTVYKQMSYLVSNLHLKINIIDSEY